MKPISLMDVKQALRDSRFRESLPKHFTEDLQKYAQNPGCACNTPFYKKLMQEAGEELKAYFPGRDLSNIQAEIRKLAENNFTVISCSIDELESKLKKLAPGRKQLAVARWEDQVTVVINELDVIY